jgi:hypothetical protein
MTFDEFNALEPGDKISNAAGHVATVLVTGPYGCKIQWGGDGPPFTVYAAGRLWASFDVVKSKGAGDAVVS